MTLPNSTPPTQPAATEPAAPAQPDPQRPYATVEEAEAFWQNRMSGRDRAHNEAENVLREQNARLQAQLQASGVPAGQPGQGAAAQGESEQARYWREQAENAARELAQTREAATISEKKAKYPALVRQGVSDDIFKASDEASLAKLNALADDGMSGGVIAPTSPARSGPVAPKPYSEMSKEELEAALRNNIAQGGHQPRP